MLKAAHDLSGSGFAVKSKMDLAAPKSFLPEILSQLNILQALDGFIFTHLFTEAFTVSVQLSLPSYRVTQNSVMLNIFEILFNTSQSAPESPCSQPFIQTSEVVV